MIEDRADEMKSLEAIPGLRSILNIEFDAGGSGGDELEDGRVEGRREERRSEDVQQPETMALMERSSTLRGRMNRWE